ncbi:MAG: toxin-antitoxin system protein [Bacilli bacterium]|nr:toxin-antitoxin system protein [Bacilli bacterium]
MVISIKLTKEEQQEAESYAKRNGLSLNDAIKRVFFEKIEDEYDAAIADVAMEKYEKNPKTYSLDELIKSLN